MLFSRYAESAIFCDFDLCAVPPLRLAAPRERLLAPPLLRSAPLRQLASSLARSRSDGCAMFARASFLSNLCVLTEHWNIHTPVAGCRAVLRGGINRPRRTALYRGAARSDTRRDATRRDVNVNIDVNSLALTSCSNPGSRSELRCHYRRHASVLPSFDPRRLGGPEFRSDDARGCVRRGRDGVRKRRTDGREEESSVVPSSMYLPFV